LRADGLRTLLAAELTTDATVSARSIAHVLRRRRAHASARATTASVR
jgi:hypothetical protein